MKREDQTEEIAEDILNSDTLFRRSNSSSSSFGSPNIFESKSIVYNSLSVNGTELKDSGNPKRGQDNLKELMLSVGDQIYSKFLFKRFSCLLKTSNRIKVSQIQKSKLMEAFSEKKKLIPLVNFQNYQL